MTFPYRGVVRRLAVPVVAILLLSGCGFFGPGASENERTVLIDYHYDQFANMFARYFPNHLTVRQGDTAVFKQAWNGEAHTVSFGGLIDTIGKPVWAYLDKDKQAPQAVLNATDQAAQAIPFMVDQNNHVQQNGAQSCYLDSGTPPTDPTTPCPKRAQPSFTGRQAFYSSGFIPYQGTDRDNSFRVPIASDAKPGTYHFICLFHGPGMNGSLTIVPKGNAIPSQDQVNTQAQAQIDRFAKPLASAFADAKKGHYPVKLVTPYKFVLAGYGSPQESDVHGYGSISEFLPKTADIKVGDTLRWLVVADVHNVAFDVPSYFPEFSVGKDGSVTWNPQAVGPVASPALPQSPSSGPGPPPAEVVPAITDGGTYDGSHFLSSGLGGGGSADIGYALTFTKAGTYHYACLIHPQMVGTVIVH